MSETEALTSAVVALLLPVIANVVNTFVSSTSDKPVVRFLMKYVIHPLALSYGKAAPDPKKQVK